ncbi:MAG: hypothetical protein VKL59_07870 [Nostocaceae cyanobacterium]|nr:hypothetical protein [Nostocaceae cyanobacterium]
MNRIWLVVFNVQWEWGMGHGALGMGHWAWVMTKVGFAPLAM